MCYYNLRRFVCGDWSWGKFAHQCNSHDRRIGDTCGLKFVYTTEFEQSQCRLCEKIETKTRRRGAETDRVNRWKREGRTPPAAMDRSQILIIELEKEIRQLQRDREDRRRKAPPEENKEPQHGLIWEPSPPIKLLFRETAVFRDDNEIFGGRRLFRAQGLELQSVAQGVLRKKRKAPADRPPFVVKNTISEDHTEGMEEDRLKKLRVYGPGSRGSWSRKSKTSGHWGAKCRRWWAGS